MRRPTVGGNWKMNLNAAQSVHLAEQVAAGAAADVEVVVFAPFVYLDQVGKVLQGGDVGLGAQNFFHEPDGAFTGEVSLAMLDDLGAGFVLAGHSERRHVVGESDLLINQKVRAALGAGFRVVLCVGETLDQRQGDRTDAVNAAQLHYGLAGVVPDQMDRLIVAYEPVWAIGTGRTATPLDAQAAHRAIRRTLAGMFTDAIADATRIQYGGSVKASNAADLFAQPDIDGGLIGSASLDAADFTAIVRAAAAAARTH